jgi:UDP-N-acetylmuramoyl-L-alanyl-D-glutamate--2,6-diaminopimelate ligase
VTSGAVTNVALSAQAAGAVLRSLLKPNAQLTSDSRKIKPGDGFVAFAGQTSDGRDYVGQAITAGAQAVAFDADLPNQGVQVKTISSSEKQLAVVNLKSDAGVLAACFYDHPSAAMQVIALTGTNGKTSCSQWVSQGLASAEAPCGVVGTLGQGLVASNEQAALDSFGLTTPDAVALQAMFARFKDRGCRYVAIEASSIGLAQSRLAGTSIDIAVFTNLTQDHLDFHGSFDAYAKAKAALFAWPTLKAAVVNLDDAASELMLANLRTPTGKPVLSVGYTVQHPSITALPKTLEVHKTLVASHLAFENRGVAFNLTSAWGDARVQLKLHGLFNVSNALAVLATWLALELPFAQAIAKLQALESVPGRLQRVEAASLEPLETPVVFVDYAHTADALEKTLTALRTLASERSGKLWCVFGAGGDRDKTKRPLMAKAAASNADLVVVTSDNPRSEDPQAIIRDIAAGFVVSDAAKVHTQPDRATAIAQALRDASASDVVLIAGKGHETYQEIAGVKYPFSDVTHAEQALLARVAA